MSKRTVIAVASGCALVATGLGLGPSAGFAASGSSAAVKCPAYTQLTGGGAAFEFADVLASNVSCKVALTVLEVFANNPPGRKIEGFVCTRRRSGKFFAANCVRGAAAVSFAYSAPRRPTPGVLLHHHD